MNVNAKIYLIEMISASGSDRAVGFLNFINVLRVFFYRITFHNICLIKMSFSCTLWNMCTHVSVIWGQLRQPVSQIRVWWTNTVRDTWKNVRAKLSTVSVNASFNQIRDTLLVWDHHDTLNNVSSKTAVLKWRTFFTPQSHFPYLSCTWEP